MTREEETRLYVDHVTRAGDFAFDAALCRWSIARHVRRHGKHGNRFVHLEAS